MRKITNDLTVSGIYCIINLKNGKRYIGSSKNIRQRLWSHRAELRHNKHDNPHLQSAWNKHGEQFFDYFIIEECTIESLLTREQHYIDTMHPEYNINPKTQKPPCTIETRLKQSNTRKKLYAEGKLQPSFKHSPTYVYDLEGNFIKEYYSMKEAALGEFGKNTGAIRNACLGKENPYHRVHNRLFYLEKLDKVPAWTKDNIQRPKSRKTYYVKSKDGIQKFIGLQAVADYFNTTVVSLRQYVNKNLRFRRIYKIYN